MTAKTVTMPVIVASGLAMLGAPDAGADVTSPLQALVDAAARRLQTADPVAASNFRTGGQVADPQREQQVIDAVTADAALADIDAGYVHNVFRNQIMPQIRWGSGRPCGRCSPTPESSGAGSTSARMFSRPCRSRRTQVPKPRLPRSTTPRTATTP